MRKIIYFICSVFFLIILFFLAFYKEKAEVLNGVVNFNPTEVLVDSGYVFVSQSDFDDNVNGANLSLDFENHNYVFVKVFYDSCAESNIKIDNYEILGDKKIRVNVSYDAKCGGCKGEFLNYLLEVDKYIDTIETDIRYNPNNDPDCNPNVAYKPLIYLYPENITDVSVKLSNPNYLTSVYPRYNNSWNVIANPDGTLIDKSTGRRLYGLYWEGNNHYSSVKSDGFVVKGEDTLEFLEDKLALLGLNELEAEEFIIYWLPKLENNRYNYIRFEDVNEINSYMDLEIEPKPDSVIRILMDYKPLSKPIEVVEQKITTPERDGFTVVEWGGSLID